LLDEALNTWGLQVSGVVNSPYTGKGIKIAVLDTGFDLNHPDFVGRAVVTQSFIPGQVVQDGHGHGTHCIGTAAGPRVPGIAPRYGIAYEASIYAGKVLSNQGSGGDGSILAGINWALMNKCQVISMSLGAVVPPNAPFSVAYEQAARRALKAGSLIIAAAGNNGQQPVNNTVGHPANCPSIMAVAALELLPGEALNVSNFSAQGVVDIAGPGRNVRSSWPLPNRYNTISGTSMATPHVAGIAALHAQATGATGYALWAIVSTAAKRLSLPSERVGVGLVQSPVVAPI
jgi:subtilisin